MLRRIPYVVAVAAPWFAVDGIGEPFHVADEYVVAHSAAEPVALCVRCAWACISQHQVYLPVVEGAVMDDSQHGPGRRLSEVRKSTMGLCAAFYAEGEGEFLSRDIACVVGVNVRRSPG